MAVYNSLIFSNHFYARQIIQQYFGTIDRIKPWHQAASFEDNKPDIQSGIYQTVRKPFWPLYADLQEMHYFLRPFHVRQ